MGLRPLIDEIDGQIADAEAQIARDKAGRTTRVALHEIYRKIAFLLAARQRVIDLARRQSIDVSAVTSVEATRRLEQLRQLLKGERQILQ